MWCSTTSPPIGPKVHLTTTVLWVYYVIAYRIWSFAADDFLWEPIWWFINHHLIFWWVGREVGLTWGRTKITTILVRVISVFGLGGWWYNTYYSYISLFQSPFALLAMVDTPYVHILPEFPFTLILFIDPTHITHLLQHL